MRKDYEMYPRRNLILWIALAVAVVIGIVALIWKQNEPLPPYTRPQQASTTTPTATEAPPLKPEEMTVGTVSYVRLRIPGELDDHMKEVLTAFNEFKSNHRDWRITQRWFYFTSRSTVADPMVYGIVIDHEDCPCVPSKK